ncbi:uncharacterized protein LOC143376905 [Andrena cerasifolii]|uniref:uncharacterized protein LOC143376905 n=1 Tax=Andrena cerasifolii TaxID=2819439 RepID=UPI004037E781
MDTYILLCTALELKNTKIAKQLLTSTSRVDDKNSTSSNSPLHFAVLNGDVEIVQMLLDAGANINVENFDRKTALHDAVERMKTEVIGMLFNREASISAANKSSITHPCLPTGTITINDSKDITNFMLSKMPNIDDYINKVATSRRIAADPGKYCPPLLHAVGKGSQELTELLLINGAPVNAVGEFGTTSLHLATQHGNVKIAAQLLRHGAYVNSACTSAKHEGYTSLHIAAEKGDEVITELLLSKGADVNIRGSDGVTPLRLAMRGGYLKIVELLFKRGANFYSTTRGGGTPLCFAIENGHGELVKVLLESGATVDVDERYDKTILEFAVEKGSSIIVNHILNHRPDLNNESNSGVLMAALKGWGIEYREIVKNLLGYGFTVKPKDVKNFMHAAVKNGYLELVQELLNHGTDANEICDSWGGEGFIPLHVAIGSGEKVVAELLLNYGADVNGKDVNGETPLHSASDCGYEKIVELLLQRGAKINAITKHDSMTPLHIAAARGELETVKVLLKLGASIDLTDRHGLTALHLATLKGQEEIVSTLLDHGSDFTITSRTNYTALGFAVRTFSDEVFHNVDYDDDYRCGYDYDDEDCHISTFANIADILKRHMIKLRTANLYTGNDDVLSIPSPPTSSDNEELSDSDSEDDEAMECSHEKRVCMERRIARNNFESKCEKEVARMKSKKFVNSNITFYDILTKGVTQLAMCAKNESIVGAFRSGDYKTRFPIYASMLNRNFKKGEERKEFLEEGNKILDLLFNDFPKLPRGCIERILNYLNANDLRALKNADKPYVLVKEKCSKTQG